MSKIAQAFLKAEEPDTSNFSKIEITAEEKALAMLPKDFFDCYKIECARCHNLINLTNADIIPHRHFICFCALCSHASKNKYANL